ncbi:M61 family metallopeptidase [Hymenobacter endophyticus]|uniref:PDZ domain-containing protein n=1 Tax=Hymenobacter endophyticus TaxID=3076335 RepID=A0ABU3TKN5_9BACT|nr:PDZ domain-containing protein [Hymenobacter endophyticus]MDU0371790.1 PDZ domain-containing protein [Hymenobacter endophyticus]
MIVRKTAALLLLALPLGLSQSALAQAPIQYELAFPNAVHHEARVTVTFREVPAGPLQVRMARSSPGRYALHEFAKNVYDVQATDAQGKPLAVTKPDPYGWTVAGHSGTVVFTYTLFGDRTDGTYAGIDQRHAHLNAPATFAYAQGLEQRPAAVKFQLPEGWTVASQLKPEAGGTWTAPNLQYLMDSPTSLGPQQTRTWQEQGRTIELQVLHDGAPAELDAYTANTKKVVKEAAAIFGGLPEYDFGRYTFIANYLPQTSGDGMEHRNSTSLTSNRPLRGPGATDNLGTVAHEFFHSWNVERLRPQDLEPFDFQRANMSSNLWFAEGFTQYYGQLLMRRAGIQTDDQYCQQALSGVVDAMLTMPGPKRYSPVYMSQQAPFVDAAAAIDPNNRSNTYLSYYYIGAANALALDLELRQRFKTDLDTYMRALWKEHGPQQNYAPAKPYTLRDLQQVLGQVTKDTTFAGQFFRQHITGHELPNYEELLAPAGLLVRPARAGQATLAARLQFNPDSTATLGTTLLNSPLYQAGLDREDVVLKVDGRKPTNAKEMQALLAAHKPGDVLPLEYRSRGQVRTASVTLQQDNTLEVVTYEQAKRPVTKAQKKFRADWLNGKAKG